MEKFWILMLLAFFVTNTLDKVESVQLDELEELPLQTFDELFVDEWWDKDEAENLKTPAPTNSGQKLHNQIDRQNTQIGQIEPNSTEQLGQIDPNSTDQLGQIKPNSTDQLGQIEPNSTDQLGQIESNSTDQLGQIAPNSTDQLGQIEPNSTDQLGQIEPNSTDQLGQIEPNSTDQNPPLTETDHYGQIEPNSTDQLGQIESNLTDQNPPRTESDHFNAKNHEIMKVISSNENIAEDERKKRKLIDNFNEMKNEFKQKGKYSKKEWVQIERKISKHLKVDRAKIYKWKKEFGLSQKVLYEKEERKHLIEKFDQRKADLMRDGFKNSHQNELNETVAKKLGLCFKTIYNWKRKLGQTTPNKHSHSEQKELMKHYYEIKDKNLKMNVGDIAKMLKIGRVTLFRWKKQFKRQQFHQNSVDGHSVEEYAAANFQEIGNSNSEYLNE